MKFSSLFAIILGIGALTPKLYASEPVFMSYYSNWDTYSNYPFLGNGQGATNNDLGYKLARINTLAYDFLEVDSSGSVYFSDAWSDLGLNDNDKNFCKAESDKKLNVCPNAVFDQPSPTVGLGNFDAFVASNVPTKLISIGGAGHDVSWQNAMAHPQAFVTSVADIVSHYQLNGVDIDYEPVGGMLPEYYPKFIDLLKQLRAQLGANAVITYTISVNTQAIAAFGKDNWTALTSQVNYINIMGYDLHGPFDNPPKTGLHSSLYPVPTDDPTVPTQLSDDGAITALVNLNVDSHKIVLGVPAYGRVAAGVQGEGLGQLYSQSYQGDLDAKGCTTELNNSSTMCGGMVQYNTLLQWPTKAIPFTLNNVIFGVYNNNNGLFASYDDVNSMAAKANYVKNNNLGGMMMWELRYDAPAVDPQGNPNPQSLINTIDEVLGVAARPFTPVFGAGVKLQLTNNDTVNANTITLISADGKYYGFPELSKSTDGKNDAMWCSADLAGPTCSDSWNLNHLGNASSVKVQITTATGNPPLMCSGTLNLTPGYHHIQVNYSNPSDMCLINSVGTLSLQNSSYFYS